ncbi:aminotransferase class V-fold PLP-dependent enzyme [Flavilitoribacter nigricans]|uniref:Aminotransferase class V domain-containing protein n=1 Tax=Flavilitoribacter nigricans (strain ATCC 23147 / DSM 23189 / NBRC 102662 / NCIMB 1420 / SS-2) TaxID=1122177 RepID=A0A2D0NJP8_FLAN2|nr:aminotransferase class V-fold PLP-dependent enzyme [Flavilitoribacter nigricans]PHN08658.1 hypothetical protein CRP01_01740 [Flavilitoribacter nigricans DSM 23189 = NBRC 102662]
MQRHSAFKDSNKQRRNFLKKIGAGLTASVATPLLARVPDAPIPNSELLLSPISSPDEAYWEMVKKQFVIPEGRIMVNAANLCPSPHFVNERVAALARDLAGDVSFQSRAKLGVGRTEAMEQLAGYLNVPLKTIGITRNTSESNNIVVNGLDFQSRDEVLIWEQNHPTNHIAWQQRARRYGFRVKIFKLPADPANPEELLNTIAAAIGPQTRLIAFSHISNVSGLALPAKAICQLARERNIMSLVDGAQSFGFIDLDLQDMGCDFYTGSTHKWLMGPMENGVLYVREERMDQIWPNIIAAGWSEDHQTLDEKVCVLGQRNTPSTPAIADILSFHQTIGKANIEKRVRELNTYLKGQLREKLPQTEFVTPLAPELSGGVTIISLPGQDSRELFSQLYEQYGIAAAPTGGVRLCPHIYCTLEDVDKVVQALVELST